MKTITSYRKMDTPENSMLHTLVDYAEAGGTMLVVGQTGAMDRWGQPRADNPLAGNGPFSAL